LSGVRQVWGADVFRPTEGNTAGVDIDGQFARPSDDKFLGFAVEISLSRWKWVKGMEQLRDLVDAQLDCVRCVSIGHGVTEFIMTHIPVCQPFMTAGANQYRSFGMLCALPSRESQVVVEFDGPPRRP
jgi:hypothetical protein